MNDSIHCMRSVNGPCGSTPVPSAEVAITP